MPNFGPLHPEDVEILVNEITVKGAAFSLYKTATVDQMMLEEKYPGMWQIEHKVCFRPDNTEEVRSIIKIYNKDLKEWMYYDNVGDEQQGENAIKKQFTDADKRAGFACGIGIELRKIPFELKFPFEKLGEKVSTGGKNDFGQELFRIPNKDLIVTDLKYENPESIRRKIVGLTVKCQSSGQSFDFDLTKDPDIKKVVDISSKKRTPKATKEKTKGVKKENATNVATPTLVPMNSDVTEVSDNNKDDEPTLESFMDIAPGTNEEVPFDTEASTEDITNTENSTEVPAENSVNEESTEEPVPLTPPTVNTPKYDADDPGSAFVLYGKFKKEGKRVRDLKPQEARYLYTSPASDDGLREAIRLYALTNEEFENDFISKGIPLRKAQ